MATDPSDPRGPSHPSPLERPAPPRTRASYPTEGHPRARAVFWAAAILSGGLLMILLFFVMIGVVDFTTAPHLAVIGLAVGIFFLATMISYARSERTGNTRWHDRERRGF